MNKNKLYLTWEKKIGRKEIDRIVTEFERIRDILFYDLDLENTINQYLSYMVRIVELRNQITSIQEEMNGMSNKMNLIRNYSVNILRKENRLENWLLNLPRQKLNELKYLVDIKNEFEKVDWKKTNQEKSSRGKLEFNLNG